MDKPLIAELEVHHENCFAIEATTRVAGSSTRYLGLGGISKRGITVIHELRSPDIEGFIRALKSQPQIKKLSIIRKDGASAEVSIFSEKDSLFITEVGESACVVIPPTSTEDGMDKCTLIAPSHNALRRLFGLLEGKYDMKLKAKRYLSGEPSFASFRSSGFLQLKAACELLTPRQFEAFDLACRYGYYLRPKRITLEELSWKMGVGKAAYAELLSKAEAKLLPVFNEVARIVR